MVTQISSLGERRYRKPGRGGADEVFAILQSMVPPGRSVSIDKVPNDPNPDGQYSIVVKIPTTAMPSKPGVLVGAHLDSISGDDTAPAPGADDDATGVATVIEMFRALMTARGGALRFNRDIYFVLYSGEEVGLFGSETVADSFCRDGVRLRGVMQLDMTGFDANSGHVFFVKGTSAVDPLLSFTRGIAGSYFGFPSGETKCPTILSNCSDHVSWKKRGYRAVFPFESKISSFNGNIHSKDDLPAHLSPAHVLRFFKIAVAFVVELGEPA
jgi:leucyl aminopeptidase